MLKDLRHAVRLLWQARGWTTVVVLSLALGIGANTAIFSAVNARLLTSLPVQKPEELVRFRYAGRNDMVTSSSGYGFLNKTPDGKDVRATFSYPMYQQFVADNQIDDGPACLRAVRPRERLRRRAVGDRERVHLVRQLLPDARRHRAHRPDDPARGRSAPPRRRSRSSAPSTGTRGSAPIRRSSARPSRSTTCRSRSSA